MRRTTIVLPAVAASLLAALAPAAAHSAARSSATHRTASTPAATPAAKPARFTKTTLSFHVTVPNEAVGGTGTQRCVIDGDLYKPKHASSHHRVPVILATNGFGGSKADQDDLGAFAASHGYGVLSYSGLGFGNSGCKISLDDPSYDGAAAKQLVSFLGGKEGIARRTSGKAYPAVRWIVHDKRAHDGHHHSHDPRVGMIGGSYGGEIQFAVADRDPRVDAIIPIITWNDLSYSLAPNNTGFRKGITYSTKAPGTEKVDWVKLFFGEGIADGVTETGIDPSRNVGCPNFLTEACKAEAELDSNTLVTPDLFHFARHASVESYMHHIKIPTLLAQGQADSLFNLQEATATYRALRHQHTPVKMIWQSWGHSDGTAAKGEYALDASALHTYEGQRFFAWFDHYLKGKHVSTGPRFAYYRDYVHFSGKGPDTVQYAAADHFPVGNVHSFYASGSGSLVRSRDNVKTGSASYSNPGGGAAESYSETSALQGGEIPDDTTPPTDAPGSAVTFTTGALKRRVDVAGIPSALLHVSAPSTSSATLASELQLFVKVYDVAPNGSVNLVHRLISAVRVLDATKPVDVKLPGIVHRFAKGHRIRLVIAATDGAYRNASAVQPVTVTTSRRAPVVLRLPIVK